MPGPAHILEEKCKKNEQKHLAMPGLGSASQMLWGLWHISYDSMLRKHLSAVNQKRDLPQYDPDYPTKTTYLARTNKTDNETKCEA